MPDRLPEIKAAIASQRESGTYRSELERLAVQGAFDALIAEVERLRAEAREAEQFTCENGCGDCAGCLALRAWNEQGVAP